MKILNPQQLKMVDTCTIEHEPIHSINLMERAATVCTGWIIDKFSIGKEFKIFVGPGNNGGDGLAIARMLAQKGYYVEVFTIGKLSSDGIFNYNRLIDQNKAKVFTITGDENFPIINENEIIIDALYGYGLTHPLIGLPALLVNYINQSNATILSIDIPSGLLAEDNSSQKLKSPDQPGDYTYENVICADFTLTLELPYLSFFFAHVDAHVGEWHVLPIGLDKSCIERMDSKNYYVTSEYIVKLLKKRKKFSHKGVYGHALLISGSSGKMGAAILASKACLRTGVGLLTTHIPMCGYTAIQTAVPENMVSIDPSETCFSEVPDLTGYNAIGVGSGIGKHSSTSPALKKLFETAKVPCVIDADAINILGENKEWLNLVPEGSIFTPHVKELERLIGVTADYYNCNQKQMEFCKKYKSIIILKGAHSSIICPDGSSYYNSTGNPGMATGGTGDVLTGMLLSLLAQGYNSVEASIIGVYLHGLAGDIAAEKFGQEALIASDIINYIGDSFKLFRKVV
jgi:NAD(P)H-hydrate epimerase